MRSVDVVELWEIDGLPYGLTTEHLLLAARVWVEHNDQRLGGDLIQVMRGAWGRPMRIVGDAYDGTRGRQEQLRRLPAMFKSSHPAILVPDPTPNDSNDVVPVGLVTIAGYIGST